MVSAHSRKFCCFLPVRLGAFVLTALLILGAPTFAALSWAMQSRKNPLHNYKTVLLIYSITYTLLAVISLLGLLALLTKRGNFVFAYVIALSVHLGFSIGPGMYTLFLLFRKNLEDAVFKCINGPGLPSEVKCRNGIVTLKTVSVAVLIVTWLVQLYTCIILANYAKRLDAEASLKYDSTSETSPPNSRSTFQSV